MKKLRAAIVGCGAIYPLHVGGLEDCDYGELAAVVDCDVSRAKEAASKHGCRYYEDFDEMLAAPDIDVVHLCTPHYLHGPMAVKALEKGRHVLSEKPMAMSAEEGEQMIKASQSTGKQLGVCFQNRYNQASLRIKELLDQGDLGRVKGGKALVTWNRGAGYYASAAWRGTWKEEGGGVLVNQAIHTLDLLQWFLGPADKLKAHVSTNFLEGIIEVEDTADAAICFKSGAHALFYATNGYVSDSPVEIEIVCEKALMKMHGDCLKVTYTDGKVEEVSENDVRTGKKAYWGTGHKKYIADFYEKLYKGEPVAVDGQEAIAVIKLIDGIYESSRHGAFVTL